MRLMNNYPFSFPKIGIRPTIDGRLGGVRESLEDITMNMAKRVAALYSKELRNPDGSPVECVIADTNIGGVREAAACEEKFKREGVGLSLTVTPCWCYGSETMDMDPHRPKAIWGFNGTERPGAVYLAAALAGHTQKGIPAFGIYGKDVQEAGDETMPEDVVEKLLNFARAGLAVGFMKGKAYLSMGGTSMGIAGSVVDSSFWERTLGMRVETIDMCEFAGRMSKGIYDQAEFEKALEWVKENCPEGKDYNSEDTQRSREQLDSEWTDSVKMALIARDLMVGNDELAKGRLRRTGPRPLRNRCRFPRPTPMDRPLPERRLHGSDPQHILRLERQAPSLHRCDRERCAQRRGYVVWSAIDQQRTDFRGPSHLLEPRRSGSCCGRLPA